MSPAIEARIRAVLDELAAIEEATCNAVDADQESADELQRAAPLLASAKASLARVLAGPVATEREITAAWLALDENVRRVMGAAIVALADPYDGQEGYRLVREVTGSGAP